MKNRTYRRLTLEEWQRLHTMLGRGKEIREIAKSLRRDRRALARAAKRYPLPWHIRSTCPLVKARYAWEQAREKRHQSRRKERLKCAFVRNYVEDRLAKENPAERLSPELISGRLSLDHPQYRISHEAIYDWIFNERKDLIKFLLRAGKPKRGKSGSRSYPQRKPPEPKKSIESRPEATRFELGHNESDLIVSARSNACLLVFVDRSNRRLHLRKLVDRKAETVRAALTSVLLQLPAAERRTLTLDNGSEHAMYAELERVTGTDVYFCHPYSAWERGTVENRNGFIRRVYPKGTDFSLVSEEQIRHLEHFMNSRPMKVLGFLSPDEFYQKQLQQRAA